MFTRRDRETLKATVTTLRERSYGHSVDIQRLVDHARAQDPLNTKLVDTLENMTVTIEAMSGSISWLQSRVNDLEARVNQAEDAGRI